MPRLNQKGFSLIELLIVIVIISILIALLAVSYTTIQRNARDSQRKSDLQTVAGALERFYSDRSVYPSSSSGAIAYDSNDCSASTTGQIWGEGAIVCSTVSYIRQLPEDPLRDGNVADQYCYVSTGQSYQLYANLEGTGNVTSGSVTGCGTGNYDYRITSND